MIKIVKHTHKIHNNPFILTPLLIAFYKNYIGHEKDILLSYLILPLVLHEDTRITLKNSKKTSSILTFGRKKENLFGLPQRISNYKDITNKCLQYAIDSKMIIITNNLQIKIVDQNINCEPSLKDAFKAAANIVNIVKNLDVVAIYRLLGVKEL